MLSRHLIQVISTQGFSMLDTFTGNSFTDLQKLHISVKANTKVQYAANPQNCQHSCEPFKVMSAENKLSKVGFLRLFTF